MYVDIRGANGSYCSHDLCVEEIGIMEMNDVIMASFAL